MSHCLGWSHGPGLGLAKLEDHGHPVLHVVVDVAVDDPRAGVVQGGSDDHVAVRGDLHAVFEDWVVEVARETPSSFSREFFTLSVVLDDELPGDVDRGRVLTLSDDVVPTTVLVDWVGYLFIRVLVLVLVDENYFEPITWGIWLLENVTAI